MCGRALCIRHCSAFRRRVEMLCSEGRRIDQSTLGLGLVGSQKVTSLADSAGQGVGAQQGRPNCALGETPLHKDGLNSGRPDDGKNDGRTGRAERGKVRTRGSDSRKWLQDRPERRRRSCQHKTAACQPPASPHRPALAEYNISSFTQKAAISRHPLLMLFPRAPTSASSTFSSMDHRLINFHAPDRHR